ncbi:hypothetical protein GALMADRAFT_213363 [Galerina marginata CBS 339.88]|uniref:Uncharacterized protein n=1 Tax=Galerina marginata (strain CBS 339.88) TaxID=685588 RepID=A0A067SN62_GALM3|nr:hypothetical protein GALMADRAFT_213363 [Galerina marginata CBS 339.88]
MAVMTRAIFVDDTDPNIEYGDGWILESFSRTTPGSNGTLFISPPIYGSLHVPVTPQAANLPYTFNGTEVAAYFMNAGNTNSASFGCTIDGLDALVAHADYDRLTCRNRNSLADGTHQIIMRVTPSDFDSGNPISFDYLIYMPSDNETSGDVLYTAGDPAIKLSRPQGNGSITGYNPIVFDFDFNGYSMSLYGVFGNISSASASNVASYSIDGQSPLIFTPSDDTIKGITQLIVQTSRYPLGQHHFHLDFDSRASLNITQIIVQNTTITLRDGNVDPFPTPVSASQSQSFLPVSSLPALPNMPNVQTEETKAIPRGIMIGGITGGALIILILIITLRIIFVIRRRRKVSSQDSSNLVRPFHTPTIFTLPSKNNKSSISREQLGSGASSDPNPDDAGAPRQTHRIRIHVDGGNAIDQPDMDAETIDLPPMYNTILGILVETEPTGTVGNPSALTPDALTEEGVTLEK